MDAYMDAYMHGCLFLLYVDDLLRRLLQVANTRPIIYSIFVTIPLNIYITQSFSAELFNIAALNIDLYECCRWRFSNE